MISDPTFARCQLLCQRLEKTCVHSSATVECVDARWNFINQKNLNARIAKIEQSSIKQNWKFHVIRVSAGDSTARILEKLCAFHSSSEKHFPNSFFPKLWDSILFPETEVHTMKNFSAFFFQKKRKKKVTFVTAANFLIYFIITRNDTCDVVTTRVTLCYSLRKLKRALKQLWNSRACNILSKK